MLIHPPRLKNLLTTPNHKPYDLIFIDADKSSYPTYLSTLLSLSQPASPPESRLLAPGALILADNILRRGLVAGLSSFPPPPVPLPMYIKLTRTQDKSENNPYHGDLVLPPNSTQRKEDTRAWVLGGDLKALDQFNTELAQNPRLETFLLPLFDGLGCGRLKD